ncbi:hypothetical protein DFQ27_006740 [Actinomortierella ambigua]|uniref:RanBP2-type domain-containing protein n=1 Tax=Actinomortierella ambigua TaxID=1343610 RepID=A0A9P6PX98_9FUNG|nr:hypothetical protein DFQ27_006740 [Actinomortierella ambigua]
MAATTRAGAAARMAQCYATATGPRLTPTRPLPHAFEPILSNPFWTVRHSRCRPPQPFAFHSQAGPRPQKANPVGQAASFSSANRPAAAAAVSPSPPTKKHASRQHQQEQDGDNLTRKLEQFLSRSGRRRDPPLRPRPPAAASSVVSSSSSSSSLDYSRESKKKRYVAAFQAGDFMCPRCGTHNFGDPDKHLRPFMARSIPQRSSSSHRSQESHSPQDRLLSSSSSSSPIPGEQKDKEEEEDEHDSALKAPLLRPRERRRRLQGAISTCIECGYSTHESTQRTASPTAAAAAALSTTTTNKDDVRLSRPREYVCDYCDTVNFAGRISCVGCGAITPSLRDLQS